MRSRQRQTGMIYVALLLAVALMGGLSAVGLKVAQTLQQRSAEAELLAIGLEFRNALQSYAEATPNGLPNTPAALAELLRDPRSPGVIRHLRRLYHDPFTGKAEWGIVCGPDQRIFGIHSLSNTPTFKRENFPVELAALSGSLRHVDWVFAIAALPESQQADKAAQIFSLK
jgi:type II secretory pathway pseudopilin PulG